MEYRARLAAYYLHKRSNSTLLLTDSSTIVVFRKLFCCRNKYKPFNLNQSFTFHFQTILHCSFIVVVEVTYAMARYMLIIMLLIEVNASNFSLPLSSQSLCIDFCKIRLIYIYFYNYYFVVYSCTSIICTQMQV